MRMGLTIAAAVIAVWLGAVQAISGVALRERAATGAWVRALPRGLAERVDRLEPHAYEPFALRLVLGREAVRAGDLARAARFADALPAGADRLALEGTIALARGDRAAAADAFLRAGDLDDVTARASELAAAGDVAGALALEDAVLARLAQTHAQADTLAEATYLAGTLAQARAYQFGVGSAQRRAWEVRARDAYARATVLAPLEERYVLAYGNQLLNVGDVAGARAQFERVRTLDPGSADALLGLGDAALRTNDPAAARAYLERARAIDPNSAAAARLARRLGS